MFVSLFQIDPAFAVAVLMGFVVGIVLHEAAHAYSAYLLGDDTAYRAGRVTLNPASHLDVLGSLMLAMAFVNALLFVFNLIPIPPLDGAKVIFPFLPRSMSGFVHFMNQHGPTILLVLVLLTFLPMFPSPLTYILVLTRPILAAFGLTF